MQGATGRKRWRSNNWVRNIAAFESGAIYICLTENARNMPAEDDYIHIAALQHFVFSAPVASAYPFTLRMCGSAVRIHRWRRHSPTRKWTRIMNESRGALKTVRGLRIHSTRLGIVGRADVVEFRKGSGADPTTVFVEFKSGQPKQDISDKVQLCARRYAGRDAQPTSAAGSILLREDPTERLCRLMKGFVVPRSKSLPRCGKSFRRRRPRWQNTAESARTVR